MIFEQKAVICIPSGRYRYMKILMPYLLSDVNSAIDEIHLWVNTDVQSDIEYFEKLEKTYSKIKLVYHKSPKDLHKSTYDLSRQHYQYNDSVCKFYANCLDDKTIYIKMDDDICYIHPDFLKNICKAVLDSEKTHLACLGTVFNVPYTTKIFQDCGYLNSKLGHSSGHRRCELAFLDGKFAVHIHEQFLQHIEKNEICYFNNHTLPLTKYRIGVMAWTGNNFRIFGGNVGDKDEDCLTLDIPRATGKPLFMVGNALVSHFAFSHQRAELEDKTDTLEKYYQLCRKINKDFQFLD
jgi:hypothetical protein